MPEPSREPSSQRSEAPVRQADAEEETRELEEERRDALRVRRRGDQEEPADPEKSRMVQHIHMGPARDDSVGVFGLIKRMLPRKQQPQPKPYRFKAFPTTSDW
jgi:hypothetical protein